MGSYNKMNEAAKSNLFHVPVIRTVQCNAAAGGGKEGKRIFKKCHFNGAEIH